MLFVGTPGQKATIGDYLDDLSMIINKLEQLEMMQPRQERAYHTLLERKSAIEQVLSSGHGIIDLPSLKEFKRIIPKTNHPVESVTLDAEEDTTQMRSSSIWDEIDNIE